jgi:hypothetical protein
MGCNGNISPALDVDRPNHISKLSKVVEIVPMKIAKTAQR